MPARCCVPKCKSNCTSRPKEHITIFHFPKNEERVKEWLRAIPRKDFTPTASSAVCILHFDESYIIRKSTAMRDDGTILSVPLHRLKLTKDAVPTIFPNLPGYLSKSIPIKRKSQEDRIEEVQRKEKFRLQQLRMADCINSFEDLKNNIIRKNNDKFIVEIKETYVSCLMITRESVSECPHITIALHISAENLQVYVWHNGKKLPMCQFKSILGYTNKCDRWSKFEALQSHLSSYTPDSPFPHDQKIKYATTLIEEVADANDEHDFTLSTKYRFLVEQLRLTLSARPTYSPLLLIFACMLNFCSASAYKMLRESNFVFLPHPNYIQKFSSKTDMGINKSCEGGCPQKSLFKRKANMLKDEDKLVNLLLDEIHVKEVVTSRGSKMEQGKTIQAFMISSMTSKHKDVVSLFPVKNLTASTLLEMVLQTLTVLRDAGYTVISIVSDNNPVSREMFEEMGGGELQSSIPNPCHEGQVLFLLFDTTDILKSIRNNWLSKPTQTLTFPRFDNVALSHKAKLEYLKHIYSDEKSDCAKFAPNLCRKVLYPSALERQNIVTAVRLFDEKNITALETRLKDENDEMIGTVDFMRVIRRWWNIVNVKTPLKENETRNMFCNPVTEITDLQVTFLQNFVIWLENWEGQTDDIEFSFNPKFGKLTKETFIALKHTSKTLIEIANFLLNEKEIAYVLFGKFQTENLAIRFGQYRHTVGATSHVSVTEILESKEELTNLSLIQVVSAQYGEFQVEDLVFSVKKPELSENVDVQEYAEVLDFAEDVDVTEDNLKALTYVAAHAARSLSKNVHCSICKSLLFSQDKLDFSCDSNIQPYLKVLKKATLKWPTEIILNVCICAYQVFQIIISHPFEEKFLQCSNQEKVLVCLINEKLNENDLNDNLCHCGRTFRSSITKCTQLMANILLSSYSKFIKRVRTS